MNFLESSPISKIEGEYTPPGDKSISHRLVMLGALAEGQSEFTHFLYSDDCKRTIEAFKEMGVAFAQKPSQTGNILTVNGVGLRGLKAPKKDLDLGNSGTTMRLLLGILAGQSFEAQLTGDASLSRRPMRRVTKPLREMGATIMGADDGNYAPLFIKGGKLKGIAWKNEIASAQVKSALLLAGLFADGETSIEEPIVSRDHTERLFGLFQVPFKKIKSKIMIQKANKLSSVQFRVPGDISSAAFFIAAALIVPNSNLIVRHVGLNPTRIGFLEVLQSMGANIKIEFNQTKDEPVGDLYVKSSRLKAIQLNPNWIPRLIDELPILMILCALAEGTSVIEGAEELRVKETDRIHSMAVGLNTIGGKIEERPDGCVISGVKEFSGGTISSFGDHRTAMSFLIAGLHAKKPIRVEDIDCIQTSYPEFSDDLKRLSKPNFKDKVF